LIKVKKIDAYRAFDRAEEEYACANSSECGRRCRYRLDTVIKTPRYWRQAVRM